MKTKDLLCRLGMNSYTQTVYLYLLEHGPSGPSGISQGTGLHRPTVYKGLRELLKQQLLGISYQGKRQIYQVEPPSALKQLVVDLQQILEVEMPALLEAYEQQTLRPTVRYYEGDNAIKQVYKDMLQATKKGDAVYRYESPRDFVKNGQYYSREYIDITCKKKELEKYTITNEQTHNNRPKRLERHSKYIPKAIDTFEYNLTQLIFGSTVAFIDFDTKTVSIIDDKRFALFHQRIFKTLFEKL